MPDTICFYLLSNNVFAKESNFQSFHVANILTECHSDHSGHTTHHAFLKFFQKVNKILNECNFLHWHAITGFFCKLLKKINPKINSN